MVEKSIDITLIGNPNTGKTSLLNSLTGMSLHVGNWPGKTVEKMEGFFSHGGYSFRIVDLPGTYSIAPYSEEERVTYEYLKENRSSSMEVIVQTIDVNSLERNLLMTMELLALGKRLVLAFNFNREAERRGLRVDVDQISRVLQVPVIAVEANKGENTTALLDRIIKTAETPVQRPDYLRELLKENNEIHHDQALKFFTDKISPYYSTENYDRQTERIDAFLLNRYTAFPIFILAMLFMFGATFTLSTPLVDGINYLFGLLGKSVALMHLPALLNSLLSEGIIDGVGSVVSFAPLIFFLFFMIAFLEDSGYLGRTVVLVDRLFHRFGISGQSFIPMILGFGCNVPAVMATRTIKNKRERLIGIMVNSFMSCGARLPVYALFCGIFFPKQAMWVIMALYLTGVAIAFIASRIISIFIKNDEDEQLILELPPYRMPNLKNMVKHAWFHTSEFIKRAGTIILGSVIVIWVLSNLPLGVTYGSEQSFIGSIGKFIAPVFKPLGFGDWTFAIALITGFVAKEVIIGTLATIHGGGAALASFLPNDLTPLGALSFLFFVLLYIPCVATLAVIKKETGKWQFVLIQVGINLSVAWVTSWVVFSVGRMLGY